MASEIKLCPVCGHRMELASGQGPGAWGGKMPEEVKFVPTSYLCRNCKKVFPVDPKPAIPTA